MEVVSTLNYPEILQVPNEGPIFSKIHESSWEKAIPISPAFILKKHQKDFLELKAHNQYEVVYFDAFAPNSQPELWGTTMMEKMFTALKPGGVLTTYCAKGVVKRTLKSIGFTIESIPGPPGKREMTRAWKP